LIDEIIQEENNDDDPFENQANDEPANENDQDVLYNPVDIE